MDPISTQTTGNAAAAPAPAGEKTPATPAPAPEGGKARDAWDRMGVSLDDLPVVGGKKETPAPEAGETEGEGGEPAKPTAQPPAESKLMTKAGRVFKDPAELLTAYENSSTEGMRLATELKTSKASMEAMNARLQEANTALTELQDYIGQTGVFPGAKTQEEIAAMTEEERYNYYSDKRAWDDKRKAYSERIANAKKESEEYAKMVRNAISRIEQEMAADAVAYPGFTDTATLRTEILKNSPHLDNRPDTPHVTYFIAQGLLAMREKAEAERLEAASKQKAKDESGAAGQAAGGGAPSTGNKPAPKDKTGLDRTVAAYKARRAGF